MDISAPRPFATHAPKSTRTQGRICNYKRTIVSREPLLPSMDDPASTSCDGWDRSVSPRTATWVVMFPLHFVPDVCVEVIL